MPLTLIPDGCTPIRRGLTSVTLRPLRRAEISFSVSFSLSQKYSGEIYPASRNGFCGFLILIAFFSIAKSSLRNFRNAKINQLMNPAKETGKSMRSRRRSHRASRLTTAPERTTPSALASLAGSGDLVKHTAAAVDDFAVGDVEGQRSATPHFVFPLPVDVHIVTSELNYVVAHRQHLRNLGV